ncbi:hypothetical protein GCM10007304_45040 [Rhodococcoides trifolii]|uniref:Uncharacterized protein n=1 Tax=Rhodococcoides trifolii TaxID=908250 RepID=A0A917G7U5_9NOCA|nr:hypothetical protein [Rhodococcus trifolii]GGG26210.1 hypothetical protein GCM10007304_45040 [Rhodococcus trifolii]
MTERPRVAAAAARASIAIRERSGREVPLWLRDTAADRPTTVMLRFQQADGRR